MGDEVWAVFDEEERWDHDEEGIIENGVLLEDAGALDPTEIGKTLNCPVYYVDISDS